MEYNKDWKIDISTVEIPYMDGDGNITDNPDWAIKWKTKTKTKEIENALIISIVKHFTNFYFHQDFTTNTTYFYIGWMNINTTKTHLYCTWKVDC